MKKTYWICILNIILISMVVGQAKNDYVSPVKHPIQLSGTFGELRTSHFHEGIDIRSSNGRVGDPLYSVNDGYISRVKIDSDGYGNVLFVTHPDGLTSVYAHLHKFAPTLADFIENYQYNHQTFLLDISLKANQFQVKRGDHIAYMGTTGRSYGPHLHFEIVDSSQSLIINPKLLGIQPTDHSKPTLNKFLIRGYSNGELTDSINLSLKEINHQKIAIRGDRMTMSIDAFDRANSANKNGVYSIHTFVDGVEFSSMEFDSIRFSDTHYYEEIIDYQSYKNGKKLYSAVPEIAINNQHLYHLNNGLGNVVAISNETKQIEIIVSDFNGNTSQTTFEIVKSDEVSSILPSKMKQVTFNSNEAYVIDDHPIYYKIEPESFVANTPISYSHRYDYFDNQKVKVLTIESNERALMKPIHLAYTTDTSRAYQPQPNCIVQIDNKEVPKFLPLVSDSIWLKTKLPEWGEYILYNDKSAPTIQPEYSKKSFGHGERIRFTIDDNLKAIHRSDYLKYTATMNGEWVLFQYDYKNRSIYHVVGDRTPRGDVKLTLVVSDALGNSAAFEDNLNIR